MTYDQIYTALYIIAAVLALPAAAVLVAALELARRNRKDKR